MLYVHVLALPTEWELWSVWAPATDCDRRRRDERRPNETQKTPAS